MLFGIGAVGVRMCLRRGRHRTAAGLSVLLSAVAPTAIHQKVATDLNRALSKHDTATALEIASTAARQPDTRAEKIVSPRYRYIWLCNPKVASRSLISALLRADPDAVLVCQATIDEVYTAHPECRDYYSFAFVRNPYYRTYSFYADKHLATSREKRRVFVEPYFGIAENRSFGDLCRWLNTPYGSDAFADRHWLSQSLNIRISENRMPDFVGHYENIDDDLRRIAKVLGMPIPELPSLNVSAHLVPSTDSPYEHFARRDASLDEHNKALLRLRYASDFQLGDYPLRET